VNYGLATRNHSHCLIQVWTLNASHLLPPFDSDRTTPNSHSQQRKNRADWWDRPLSSLLSEKLDDSAPSSECSSLTTCRRRRAMDSLPHRTSPPPRQGPVAVHASYRCGDASPHRASSATMSPTPPPSPQGERLFSAPRLPVVLVGLIYVIGDSIRVLCLCVN
jgi:hypothetical protein